MIHNYILNNKVTKEALDEEKENNNESYMNYKNEYDNDKDCDSVRDKGKNLPSESAEE